MSFCRKCFCTETKVLFGVVILLGLFSCPVYARDSYVATTGNDNNDGSLDRPFLTLNYAVPKLASGDTLHISAGTYNLTANLVIPASNITLVGDFDTNGVTADSSSVIIDRGDSSSFTYCGIYASAKTGITIRDLQIQNAYYAIQLQGADENTISSLRSTLNIAGILVNSGSDRNQIYSNDCNHNSYGIYINNNSTDNVVSYNAFNENYHGMYVVNTDSNLIQSNQINENTQYGIYLYYSSDSNVIRENTIDSNTADGICLYQSSNFNRIQENTVQYNGNGGSYDGGVVGSSSNCNQVTGNNISFNNKEGVCLVNSDSNLVEGNTIVSNSLNGIQFYSTSDYNKAIDNLIFQNGGSGIYVALNVYRNRIERNRVYSNGANGIYLNNNSTGNVVLQNDIVNNGAEGYAGWAYEGHGISVALSTCNADTIAYNNIVGSNRKSIYCAGVVNDARFNYYGMTDTQSIADSMTGLAVDSWVTFRFDWIDTSVNVDTIAPSAPNTVATTVLSTECIQVSWAVPTEDENGSSLTGLAGYRVYRDTDPQMIHTGDLHPEILETTSENFTDSGLATGTTYYYWITAFDDHAPYENESWYSSSCSGTTLEEVYANSDWYVDTNSGNDVTGAGTPENPFKTIGRALEVLSLGETVHIAAGEYYLSSNLVITADSDDVTIIGDFDTNGVTADSSNVIIDRNNESVDQMCFMIQEAEGVGIKSLQVRDANIGIKVLNCDSVVIEDVTAFSNQVGIRIDGAGVSSGLHTISSCSISGNGNGLYDSTEGGLFISGAVRALVRRNRIELNWNGIYADDSGAFLIIEDNAVDSNSYDGIYCEGSDSATIRNNSVSGNGREGIIVDGITMNGSSGSPICAFAIVNNQLCGNGFGTEDLGWLGTSRDSIKIFDLLGTNSYVYGNTSTSASGDGLCTYYVDDLTIDSNVFSDNYGGMDILNSKNCSISSCVISGNDAEGIEVGHTNTSSGGGGISPFPCEDIEISYCLVENNNLGIEVLRGAGASTNSIHILRNEFRGNEQGVYVYTGIGELAGASGATVEFNNFYNNVNQDINRNGTSTTVTVNDNYHDTTYYPAVDAKLGNATYEIPITDFRFDYVDTKVGADVFAPEAPDTVTAVEVLDGGETVILISWAVPTEDEDGSSLTGLAGYRLFRTTNVNLINTGDLYNDADLKVTLSSDSTSYYDTTATDTTVTYYYYVTAYDSASPYENESWFSTTDSEIYLDGLENSVIERLEQKVFEMSDLKITVSLSSNETAFITDMALQEEVLTEETQVTTQDNAGLSSEPESVELERLWRITFYNPVGDIVLPLAPVKVTIENASSEQAIQADDTREDTIEFEELQIIGLNEEDHIVIIDSFYNEELSQWTAEIEDLTSFGLGQVVTQAVSSSLQNVTIFPNPWALERNSSGDRMIKFDNLTADAHIEIYNTLGELVLEGQISNGATASDNAQLNVIAAGRVGWTLKNQNGELVASGIYIVIFTNSQGERVIRKVAVVR